MVLATQRLPQDHSPATTASAPAAEEVAEAVQEPASIVKARAHVPSVRVRDRDLRLSAERISTRLATTATAERLARIARARVLSEAEARAVAARQVVALREQLVPTVTETEDAVSVMARAKGRSLVHGPHAGVVMATASANRVVPPARDRS